MSNKYLIDTVEANIQKVTSSVDDIENNLNQIKDALERMKEIAIKATDNHNEENDRIQMQNEINQLSYELNHVGDIPEFEETNLLAYNGQKTACLCTVAPGVDMSSVTLNGKDSRLTGDLTELIDNYIYTKNGLEQGTDVTITLDTNGRVILSGYISEYSTGSQVYPKAYYMTSSVNEQDGNITFSGYGLSFTIPYQEYIEFLANGVAEKTKHVNIRIDNYYDRVYQFGRIPTDGYVNYYGSGTKLTNFVIRGADNLISFYMSGTTGSYTSGATALHVMYTLADGTKVDDNVYNYNKNIKEYLGAGKIKITFDYYPYRNPYYDTPYFIINLPSIYRLTRAGGLKTYQKTSKIVDIPYSYPYSAAEPALYSTPQNLLDISNPTVANEAVSTIDNAIEKVDKKLSEISNLKSEQ